MASSSSQCSFTSSISPTESYHTAYVTEYSGDFVEGCSLHLAYTLPPDVFVDPYELRYDISTFDLQPMPNLELPVKIASYNTSTLTVQLETPTSSSDGSYKTPSIKIPIHARYGEPNSPRTSDSSYHTIQLTAPRGYWSCPKHRRKLSFSLPCFIFTVLAQHVETMLTTRFFNFKVGHGDRENTENRYAQDDIDVINCSSHLDLADGSADAVTLRIPVGSRDDLDVVELSTTVVVLGLLAYLLWVFITTARHITGPDDVRKHQ